MTYRALYPTARSPQKYGASRHTPLICVNVFSANSNRQIPLFTKSIQRAIDLRDLAYSRWKTFRTVELKFQYSAARANVNKCIRCAKMEYYSRRFAFAMETRQTWRTIREIGLCNTHHNTSCQIDPNDLNKSFVNTPMVRADPNFYSFHRDHANSDIGFNIDKFRFECVTQYDVMSAAFIVKFNSIGSDNMHPKFISGCDLFSSFGFIESFRYVRSFVRKFKFFFRFSNTSAKPIRSYLS